MRSDAGEQLVAAAGDEAVDVLVEAHLLHRGLVGRVVEELHGVGGEAGLRAAVPQHVDDGPVGALRTR